MTATPAILVGIGRSSVFPELSSHDADLVSAEAQDPGGGLHRGPCQGRDQNRLSLTELLKGFGRFNQPDRFLNLLLFVR